MYYDLSFLACVCLCPRSHILNAWALALLCNFIDITLHYTLHSEQANSFSRLSLLELKGVVFPMRALTPRLRSALLKTFIATHHTKHGTRPTMESADVRCLTTTLWVCLVYEKCYTNKVALSCNGCTAPRCSYGVPSRFALKLCANWTPLTAGTQHLLVM